MRYLVITDDELVLKNIKLNNSCTIAPAASLDRMEMPFEKMESGVMCPWCGAMLMAATGMQVNYCMNCGTKNTGVNNELA